jgi:ABC-type multidrug transport system ATPase subunit
MKNMIKIYEGRNGSGPHLAVNDVSLAVEKNTVFGLLGFVYFLT